MRHQFVVSDSELELILELVEHEHKELLVETRHTDARQYRAGLHERLETVEALRERLQAVEKN
ncbi:MAG TPA: hypothetical protein VMU80_23170 [Bryobacteraceae bacterium]|nr:hypothetical protein [Bryobacteraceae bacterium]HUO32140.1 hypothetical protein [Bryobacteraceae bacterium]